MPGSLSAALALWIALSGEAVGSEVALAPLIVRDCFTANSADTRVSPAPPFGRTTILSRRVYGRKTRPRKEIEGDAADWGAKVWLSPRQAPTLGTLENRPSGDQFDVGVQARQTGPDRLKLVVTIEAGRAEPVPVNLTLLVDRSAAMADHGRLDQLRRAVGLGLDQLREGDGVQVVLFDDQVCTPIENFVVGRDDPQLVRQVLDQLEPRGGADLGLGLAEAERAASADPRDLRAHRRLMLLTHAEAVVGDTDPEVLAALAHASEIRFTAVGFGPVVQQDRLTTLAEQRRGASVFVETPDDVERLFGVGWPSLVETFAAGAVFALDLPYSLALERVHGLEASFSDGTTQAVSMAPGTRQTFDVELKMNEGTLHPDHILSFAMSWTGASGRDHHQTFATTVGALVDPPPEVTP